MKVFDAIIIGGGHNGLILGNYLAKAGLKTLILERRVEIGGGLSTEEITIPGFLHNLHSYFHDTINIMPSFIDLKLEDYNAKYFRPPVQAGISLSDGMPSLSMPISATPANRLPECQSTMPRPTGR